MFIVAALVLVTLVPAYAGAEVAYPLRIDANYEFTGAPDVACRGMYVTAVGSAVIRIGDGDGLQSFPGEWSQEECVDVIAAPGAFTLRDATFKVATAAGDLVGTYSGRGGLPDSNLEVHLTGTFAVTGGTGAFAGATGEGITTWRVNPVTNAVVAALAGVLRL